MRLKLALCLITMASVNSEQYEYDLVEMRGTNQNAWKGRAIS